MEEAVIETWKYLRMAYYPRFLSEIVKMPWDFRYDVLKEIHGDWKILSDEPIEDMMDYVFDKGYFGIFSRGVIVNEAVQCLSLSCKVSQSWMAVA